LNRFASSSESDPELPSLFLLCLFFAGINPSSDAFSSSESDPELPSLFLLRLFVAGRNPSSDVWVPGGLLPNTDGYITFL
jgi:hypothetical protein